MQILIAVLIVLLLSVNIALWRSDDQGVRKVRALQADVAAQEVENARLTERNEALAAEVDSLKKDLEAIEERARTELGMIREGETFFHILDEAPTISTSEQQR